MKKILVGSILLAALTGASTGLMGCGSDDGSTASAPAPQNPAPQPGYDPNNPDAWQNGQNNNCYQNGVPTSTNCYPNNAGNWYQPYQNPWGPNSGYNAFYYNNNYWIYRNSTWNVYPYYQFPTWNGYGKHWWAGGWVVFGTIN